MNSLYFHKTDSSAAHKFIGSDVASALRASTSPFTGTEMGANAGLEFQRDGDSASLGRMTYKMHIDEVGQPYAAINRAADPSDEQLVHGCFRLRHEAFNERLNWDVVSYDGHKVDEYDVMNPWYVILEDTNNEVVGTWRALPTTDSYMLRDVFPQLSRGEEIPCDSGTWEISRFAVDRCTRELHCMDGQVSGPARTLVDSFYRFAALNEIKRYVAVTSTAGARMLERLGLPVRRMGDGQAMKVGSVNSTAIIIDMASLDGNP